MGKIEMFNGCLNPSTLCNEEATALVEATPTSNDGPGVWGLMAAISTGILATSLGLKFIEKI